MNDYIVSQNESAKQSYLAPSERHLEDWIAHNFDNFNQQIGYNFHRLIGRQVRFPSGVADLVIAGACCIFVVELKKGRLDGAAVSQLNHYLSDGLAMHRYLNANHYEKDDLLSHKSDVSERVGSPSFRGILIGSSFDRLAEKTCASMDIDLIQYSLIEGEYEFDRDVADGYYQINEDAFSRELIGGIKEVMRHLHLYETDVEALKSLYRHEGWLK